ncbi:MAG: hypothetical protein COA80_07720 [Leeuwenhoekiella sp.]|nr:MAG: hypothetical protein COA80_07720 [Leeuwenhoekiella sp.]
MRILAGFLLLLLGLSCSPDSPEEPKETTPPTPPVANTAPPKPDLIYPSDNLLCTVSELTFEWSQVTDPDGDVVSFSIDIATDRSFTDVVESRSLNTTSLNLNLAKGTAYYWRVRAKDSENNWSPYTDSNAFYVEGEASTNYVPFKAKCIYPLPGAIINETGEITLKWETADLDGDSLTYDIYLRSGNTTTTIAEKISETEFTIQVSSGMSYSWSVTSSDGSSQSFSDTWSFKVE